MDDIQALKDQNQELKNNLVCAIDEKHKLGVMYEELQKDYNSLKLHNEYLGGQVDAFRRCIECLRGYKNA